MASVVNSFAISGVEGYLVDVEVKAISGLPMISIVGLGDTAIKEARERVEAAIYDSHFHFPEKKVVINLAPSDIKKSGSHFDLPIAIGMLIETGQITLKNDCKYTFIGELSLNAKLRACSGILPMVIAAKNANQKNIIVPKDNLEEASLVSDVKVFGFENLREVTSFLEGKSEYFNQYIHKKNEKESNLYDLDFSDVHGQDDLIDFVMLAAAGGHNLLMMGAPGCGKSMIAKRIPSILPSMSEEEALEVTKIYSVAGLVKEMQGLIHERPFRAPHHNASTNSLIGGGNNAKPGEISLAHNGVLFLDEIAEFSKKSLEGLRQPMEDKAVTISRVRFTNTYPANFMLAAAMNPCPCGYFGTDKCKCTDYEIIKYRQKISGPILDRMDIQKYVRPVDFIHLTEEKSNRSSAEIRERVESARKIQQKRFENIEDINSNAQMNNALIKRFCKLESEGQKLLERAYDRFSYSARAYQKYLKIGRTLADLDGSKNIRQKDISIALMSRDLEKDQITMSEL